MEESKVLIWSGLKEWMLKKTSGGSFGWIFGVRSHDSVALLSGIRSTVDSEKEESKPAFRQLTTDLGRSQSMLPPGIDVVGAYAIQHAGDTEAALQQLKRAAKTPEGCKVFIGAVISDTDIQYHCFIGDGVSQVTSEILSATDVQQWLESRFSYLRLNAEVDVEVYGARCLDGNKAAPSSLADASSLAFDRVETGLTGPSSVYVLSSGTGRHILFENGEACTSCGELGGTLSEPLNAACFCRRQASGTDIPNTAPVLEYCPAEGGPVSMDVASASVDVLCLVPRSLPISELPDRFIRSALRKQLAAMRAAMLEEGCMCNLKALHFQPPSWVHPITILYPLQASAGKSLEAAEERLLHKRQQLHEQLGLPTDRPLLRIANALVFDRGTGSTTGLSRLADVHVGLPSSGVPGGTVHLVDGSYEYYHYMQDKFDDSGWGCAYRSLQTICSWFQRQHYTSKPVPSHQQIQQTLVDIGDKPRNFVGSKQWIGAIELGFILDTLLGVSCRVITVSSGAEMASKAREIAHHFDTQGTPIMIGGGVLAYTLLGIDFNERTGACAFLILDPHFTGADDLRAIHRGHWVAWKQADGRAAAGGDLFVKDAFYNLLCPQRPCMV
ncbi:probable Ufm1-specific protease 2 at C-terminar half [Coccomyxa sp. Obi]|nr:probable Ufm1-specific protease 2 at C-terminar half [Coccomyxa sp. Obi]